MVACRHLNNKMCNTDKFVTCDVCLLAQIADNTSLLITAIGNLTASIEERLCMDKKAISSKLVICNPKEHDEHCNGCKHAKLHEYIYEQCDEVCFFSGKACKEEQK